ncbi:MAG: PRC-barrel domain-containing protein [Euryarchaeota archaeon]|nr:PRC-barrel domain-containing protein [Euryarchaeota archaeon]
MSFFKKKETENVNVLTNQTITSDSAPKIKRKVLSGFDHKTKKERKHGTCENTGSAQGAEKIVSPLSVTPDKENTIQQHENIDVFLEEIITKDNAIKEGILNTETAIEHEWPAVKRKAFTQNDMKGKQVYLEDTGEKIGTVFDAVVDADKNLIGYKIKDSKSETILSFPLDQFDEDKNGLIFVPSWYMKGMKTIEKLEFKDRITPELIWLIKDNTVSTEELYSIFVKHDDKITNYIEEAVALRELVNNRLKILEKERLSLKETLMDLTEKRLIKDIDRRQFSEIVMDHRRKVNIVDVNIKKCKELLDRLQRTSFGLLSTSIASTIEKEEHREQHHAIESPTKENISSDFTREDPYKGKYFELKGHYEKLQEGYNELKIAVEKLLNKNEF